MRNVLNLGEFPSPSCRCAELFASCALRVELRRRLLLGVELKHCLLLGVELQDCLLLGVDRLLLGVELFLLLLGDPTIANFVHSVEEEVGVSITAVAPPIFSDLLLIPLATNDPRHIKQRTSCMWTRHNFIQQEEKSTISTIVLLDHMK